MKITIPYLLKERDKCLKNIAQYYFAKVQELQYSVLVQ